MAEGNRQHRQHVIQAIPSEQRANNSRTAPTQYREKRVPCSGCGKRLLWTAEQQRYWYEEMKASVYAATNLRCDNCRKMGRNDLHREKARSKQRRRFGSDG